MLSSPRSNFDSVSGREAEVRRPVGDGLVRARSGRLRSTCICIGVCSRWDPELRTAERRRLLDPGLSRVAMRAGVALHGTGIMDGTSMGPGALVRCWSSLGEIPLVWSGAIRIGIRAIEIGVISEMLVG